MRTQSQQYADLAGTLLVTYETVARLVVYSPAAVQK